jgi:hypothetical protein
MIESYPEMEESFWRGSNYTAIAKFPEGQLVIVVDGIVVGSALSLWLRKILLLKHGPIKHRKFHVLNSQSDGEVLYGIDVLLILNIEA